MISLSIWMLATLQQAGSRLSRRISQCVRSLAAVQNRREATRILGGLDDHLLRDIGLAREQIGRARWRLPHPDGVAR